MEGFSLVRDAMCKKPAAGLQSLINNYELFKIMFVKLLTVILLTTALFAAVIGQTRPVSAVSRQSLKEQLLDKILSEQEGQEGNRIVTAEPERPGHIRPNVNEVRDNILDEAGITLSEEEAKQVNQEDSKILSIHASSQDNNCRDGNVLAGASNKKDLKVLSKCEEVIGTVKHTKKMNDGDYKFALKVRDKYKFLLNKINKKKTGGYLIVEIVPKDQKDKNILKPKKGDRVDVWGAWVTDKPKGWHEIHPAWKVMEVK